MPSQMRSSAACRAAADAVTSSRTRRPLVDRLEAGEDGRIVGLRSQEGAEPFDPVLCGAIREVHPEDVVEDRVVRRPDRVHVGGQQPSATKAVRDVHVARAIGVQPQREQRKPDMVRRESGHRGPLEPCGLQVVQPGILGRDLHVAVERAAHVRQHVLGQGLPAGDRVRRLVPGDDLAAGLVGRHQTTFSLPVHRVHGPGLLGCAPVSSSWDAGLTSLL